MPAATRSSATTASIASPPKPMRINFVLPRPSMSGGIKAVRLLADALWRRGHTVRICYPQRSRRPGLSQARDLLRHILRPEPAPAGLAHLHGTWAELIPTPRAAVRSSDVPDGDLLIATWWETAEWIEKFPDRCGRKAYFIQHHEVFGGAAERVEATYRLPYLQLTIAHWLKEMMATRYGNRSAAVVTNGIDPGRYRVPRRGKHTVPTVGMMYSRVAWKGSQDGFDAIRRLQRTMPKVRVVCFGAHEIADDAVVPANMEYHHLPSQELIPLLHARCDAWLLPSISEGFGLPGLEAAACRCPLVVTRCGGPADYVRPGISGHIVPVGDIAAMADRLRCILSMPQADWQAMSDASRAIALSFTWERSAAALEAAARGR